MGGARRLSRFSIGKPQPDHSVSRMGEKFISIFLREVPSQITRDPKIFRGMFFEKMDFKLN
jgi:hypothetical protein